MTSWFSSVLSYCCPCREGPYEEWYPIALDGIYEVMLASRRQENEACYVIKKPLTLKACTYLEREISILTELNAKDQEELYGIIRIEGVFERWGKRHLVLEYMRGGDLSVLLAQKGPLTIDEVGWIAKQVLSALTFLQSQGVAHGDLKLHNIVYDEGLRVKLIDFGSSFRGWTPPEHFRGTPGYFPPEYLLKHTLDSSVDLWTFGCILATLYTGRKFFAAQTKEEHFRAHQEDLGISYPEDLSKEHVELSNSERKALSLPSPKEPFSSLHYWLEKGRVQKRDPDEKVARFFLLLTKLFTVHPARRITASRALVMPFFHDLKQEKSL